MLLAFPALLLPCAVAAEHYGLVPLLLLSGNKLRVWPSLCSQVCSWQLRMTLPGTGFSGKIQGEDIFKHGCSGTLHS